LPPQAERRLLDGSSGLILRAISTSSQSSSCHGGFKCDRSVDQQTTTTTTTTAGKRDVNCGFLRTKTTPRMYRSTC
jgi:hypothetical protein